MGSRAWGVRAMAVAIAAVAVWLLVAVWRSPHRGDLATFGAYAVAVAGLAGSLARWAWRAGARERAGMGRSADLDQLADELAVQVGAQWARAAAEQRLQVPEPLPVRWGKPSLPLAGPVSAAVGSTRFPPLPGLTAIGGERLSGGGLTEDLHAVYGGLGSGRLIIGGRPGSGKSAAAVLLLLAALRHREQAGEADRRNVPVPVLFTVQGWDPVGQRVSAWLSERLAETYVLLAGKGGAARAADLLAAGRLSVILDGLDEIPAVLRPAALRALSQQATFRLVILTRSEEMADTAAHAVLDGAAAVELQDVDPSAVAEYLTSVQRDPPPRGWRDLVTRLEQDQAGPLARALSAPLTVSLVRDTYRSGDDVSELLDLSDRSDPPATGDDITGHLLDRVLPAAYSPRPGEPLPQFDLATAQRTLHYIATRMNRDGTRDLLWWRIPAWQPASGPVSRFTGFLRGVITYRKPAVVIGFLYATALGLAAGVISGTHQAGLRGGLIAGFAVGLLMWPVLTLWIWLLKRLIRLVAGRAARTGSWGPVTLAPAVPPADPRPRRVVRARPIPVLRPQVLALCLAGGLICWAASGVLLAFACVVVTLVGSIFAFGPASGDSSPLSPQQAWRSDRLAALMVPLVTLLYCGALVGRYGFANGAVITGIGLLCLLVVALPASATWNTAMAFARLARRERTPLRLIRFLEDARERQVLRSIGPIYQFRHARLQDRLAGTDYRAAIPQTDLT